MPEGADAVVQVEDTIQSVRPGMEEWRSFWQREAGCFCCKNRPSFLLDLVKFKSIVRSSDPQKVNCMQSCRESS